MTSKTYTTLAVFSDTFHRLVSEARAQRLRIAEAHVGMNSHGQQADQRRQDDSRHDAFVRTARAAEPEAEQNEQNAAASAERFA